MSKVSNKSSTSSKIVKKQSKWTRRYLILYNAVQTIGWSYLLYRVINYYINPTINLYDTVKCPLILFQNLAIFEVFHAAFRLVSSSVMVTLTQIASRVVVVCGVLMLADLPRLSIGFPMLLFAWSITEIIRYSNYTFNLLKAVPYILVWLRYTSFIILYPIGVTGELLCTIAAVREISRTGLLSITLPNRLNFIFIYHYFLIVVMLFYIPGFPQLYLHMFAQRRKVLGSDKTKSA